MFLFMNTNSLVNTTFFKKGDTIKGGHYSRGDIIQGRTLFQEIRYTVVCISVGIKPCFSDTLLQQLWQQ